MSEVVSVKTVAVLGEVLADVFTDMQVIGGAPFNVARHLHALNSQTIMISRIGQDALAQQVLSSMEASGLSTVGMQQDAVHPTGKVMVEMHGAQHQFQILPEQAYDFIDTSMAMNIVTQYQPALLYFGSLALRHPCSRNAIAACNEHFNNSCETTPHDRFLDINLRSPWYDQSTLAFALTHATVLKLNVEELGVLNTMFNLSASDGSATAIQQARHLKTRYRLSQVIVTSGDQGAWMLDDEDRLWQSQPTQLHPAAIVDTVGAGDAFSAVCMLGRLQGWEHGITLQRANELAGAICTVRGAVPADAGFYDTFIAQWHLR